MTLAKAKRLGEALRRGLKIVGGPRIGPKRIWIVGSVRRGKASTKDLDMLLVLPNASAAASGTPLSMVAVKPDSRRAITLRHSYASGSRRRSFIVGHGGKNYRVDVFLAYDAALPFALMHHTGSHRYNIRIRAHAKRAGWKLNQYGLFVADKGGKKVAGSSRIKSEADLARFLGVSVREPANRER